MLLDPLVLLGLALYAPFVVAAVALFWRADPWRQRWTLAALVVAGAISAWRFDSTPAGIENDSRVLMSYLPVTGFVALWTAYRTFAGQGWNVLPWWVFNVATGTYYGERVVGLLWHATLILAAGALVPRRGVPLALAFAATSPAVLWLSRNSLGVEILVQQLYLMIALDALRGREDLPHWNPKTTAVVAGLCLGALQYTYIASRLALVYPALWLWRTPRRACAVYMVAVICMLPMAFADWAHWEDPRVQSVYARHTWDWQSADHLPWAEARRTVVSVLWNDAAAQRAMTYCFGGAQTLAPTTLPLMVTGVFLGGAWPYLPAWGAGLLPDIVGSKGGGRSHRVIMIVVPTVLLLAQAGRAGPPWLVALAAGVIGIDNIRQWVHLWNEHHREGRHGYPEASLLACATDPPPEWCRWSQ